MKNMNSPNNPLDLSDFQLEQAVFEARYALAYLHWDRAGAIWTEARTKWPGLQLSQAEPAGTQFTLENRYALSVSLDKATAVDHRPDRVLKSFVELLEDFVELITRRLEITDYSRIGLRLIFMKQYPDQEAASFALLSTNILRIPEGPRFGIDSPPILPEYAVRWEGKATGTTVRMKAEGRKYGFDPPLDWKEVSPVHKEEYYLKFDIDYYTVASVAVGQFSAKDWIDQALHFIRRDSKAFLGGT